MFTPKKEILEASQKINARNVQFTSSPTVIIANLQHLYNGGIARNQGQFNIMESLLDFHRNAGFLTSKQLNTASSIVLANANAFEKSEIAVDEKAATEAEKLPFVEQTK